MEFISLPELSRFKDAYALMQVWAQTRATDESTDRVLFIEHYPVITRGRGLQFKTGEETETRERSKPIFTLIPEGVDYAECERGGDLTWHGPGQLVMYPIIKINDIAAYIRRLEQVAIDALEHLYGITGFRIKDSSGVWVKDHYGQDKKIASVGIAVRKWVTLHGIAINVVNDPAGFNLISPCGFKSDVMTRVADFKSEIALKPWRAELETALASFFVNPLSITENPNLEMPTSLI
ncbi:MAG: lipoyl(octanoyl) transferase LipB [Xanthomonadaceae bacterium]|nr:lipoyl(octanoyl) transferase LipB [Xanthomonadaceae bacterium]